MTLIGFEADQTTRIIVRLTKLYGNEDEQYSGNMEDDFDFKFAVFAERCRQWRVGITVISMRACVS